MNEYVKNGLLVASGGIAAWLATGVTDRIDAGSEMQIRNVAKQVYIEQSMTDSGKSISAVLSEHGEKLTTIETNVGHIKEAVDALAN